METSTFTFRPLQSIELSVYRWSPEGGAKAVVQIAHDQAEHAGRYARLADALTRAGYAVYAHDQRGHGRSAATPGHAADRGGWDKCIADLWQVNDGIARDRPGLPIVLLGQGMGAALARHFMAEYGESLAGVILSGASNRPSVARRLVARVERLRLGPRGISPLLTSPRPTGWLSRDTEEIDSYDADPLCGIPVSIQFWLDLAGGLGQVAQPGLQAHIPDRLPIHLIAGTADPSAAALPALIEAYRTAGLKRVTHHLYAEARHALFHETNRDEVTSDIIAWLDGVIG